MNLIKKYTFLADLAKWLEEQKHITSEEAEQLISQFNSDLRDQRITKEVEN